RIRDGGSRGSASPALPPRDAVRPGPGGPLLRVSHQAAGVSEPVPWGLPPWRGLARGDDRARGDADPATSVTLAFRFLRYLRPYRAVFLLAVLATSLFAGLDAFSLALLIPFLETLFADPSDPAGAADAAVAAPGEREVLDRLMDGTVGRFVDLTAPPAEAIRGIILFLLVIVLLKNVFDYLRTYLVAWIEQAVTRDLRNEVYDHLLELDLSFF